MANTNILQTDSGGGQPLKQAAKKSVFAPRFNQPDLKDPNFINTEYGGKNSCIVCNATTGSVLPNCVGYAWGRFMEILGKTPSLCCGDAGTWYGYKYDEYKRGNKAQLGAVICWSQPGEAGHVAIVEQINPDGSIVISQSGYDYKIFWTETIPADYSLSGYVFQGFIYNPACDDMVNAYSAFMDVVLNSVNKTGAVVRAKYNLSKKENWNALFIPYCMEEAGIQHVVPAKKSATDFVKVAIQLYGAIWHDGHELGDDSYKPQKGDIVCYVSDSSKIKVDRYYTDRLAVVSRDTQGMPGNYTVYAIEGDVNDKVSQCMYTKATTLIKGYLELNWSRAGASRMGVALYDETNDSDDAIMREVSFISGDRPTINQTDIRLSVINYTSQLSAIFQYFGGSVTSDALYDDDEIVGDIQFENPMTYEGAYNNNGSIIFNEFMRQGVTVAAAVGIMSYMWFESRWAPDALNTWENQPWDYRGRGLAQWSLERSVNFVKAVPNWKTNITGQVRYCVSEMQSSYRFLYNTIMSLPNTKSGVTKAATKVSLVYGAGLSLDWDDTHTPDQYPYGGEWGLSVHVKPAEWMWDNNIKSAVKPADKPSGRKTKDGNVTQEEK